MAETWLHIRVSACGSILGVARDTTQLPVVKRGAPRSEHEGPQRKHQAVEATAGVSLMVSHLQWIVT